MLLFRPFFIILCIYFCCPYLFSHLSRILPGPSAFMSHSCLDLIEAPFARCSSIFSREFSFPASLFSFSRRSSSPIVICLSSSFSSPIDFSMSVFFHFFFPFVLRWISLLFSLSVYSVSVPSFHVGLISVLPLRIALADICL